MTFPKLHDSILPADISVKDEVAHSNILLNAFRVAVNGGSSMLNMVDGIVDEFEDETGVDAATSTNETYDGANDLYTNTAGVNMTLVADSFTAEAEPDEAFVVLWQEDVDAVTLNTDLKAWVSIDNGSTWDQATLAEVATLDTGRILTGTVDVSARTGTTMIWKIETLNSKEIKVHGVGLEWS